jgi:SPASM domain peptide maturase of grasp-with-spasm system
MLFANCIPVKGNQRSLVCDLQRQRVRFIPNLVFEILTEIKAHNYTIKQLKKRFQNAMDEGIDMYLNDLVKDEFGIYTNEIKSFTLINMEWEYPSLCTNAIIDLNEDSTYDYKKFIALLDDVRCPNVQIRLYNNQPVEDIKKILKSFENTSIRCIEILLKFSIEWTVEALENLFSLQKRVLSIIVHSVPESINPNSLSKRIEYVKTDIHSNKCCGVFNAHYFNLNIEHFSESLTFNTCLNRKISIDAEGYIRNCPSMREHYGNIEEITIMQVLAHPDLKKYWYVAKDQINICKDCEFRYICTDCRAFLEDPADRYSKPLKCGYNPYTCEWEEWSTNPLKQKAIDHYHLRPVL